MTIEAQITKLELAVSDFDSCVASLTDEVFLERINGWSPRDILAHLIGWNRYVIEGADQIKSGELPFYDIDPGENYSNVNAVLVREYFSTDRGELLDELHASTQELARYLESVDPSEWDHDYGVRHGGSVITIRNTVDELIADYAHHRMQIQEWAR